MKKSKRIIIIAVMLILALSLAGCGGDENNPKGTVVKFFKAFDSKDVDAMVSCIEPEAEKELRASGQLVSGKLEGVKISDVLKPFSIIFQRMDSSWDETEFNAKIKIGSEKVYGDEAIVNGEMTLSTPGTDGKTIYKTQALQFDLKNFAEGWRIVAVK